MTEKLGYTWDIPTGTEATPCRGCGADIYWIKTTRGKNLPLDPDGRAHFSSCPNAEDFRRDKNHPDKKGKWTEDQVRAALRKGMRVIFEELGLKVQRTRPPKKTETEGEQT